MLRTRDAQNKATTGPTPVLSPEETEERRTFHLRMLRSFNAAADLASIDVGHHFGFYRALVEEESLTSAELAVRTHTHERYVREWLEQQAVSGIVHVDDAVQETSNRRYRLLPAHAEVLLDQDSLFYGGPPVAQAAIGSIRLIDQIIGTYLTGEGIPRATYGPDLRGAGDGWTRPLFANLLTAQWLPALPEIHSRLQANPPAVVADIVTRAGRPAVAIARAYPNVRIHAFDPDAASIEQARQNAAQAGVANRIQFQVQEAVDLQGPERYDFVILFDALYEMAQPVEALRRIRALVEKGGAVLIADKKVSDEFTAPGDDLTRFAHGMSILFGLPAGMADKPTFGTGAVIRPATVRRYAREAGFKQIEIPPIEHKVWQFYLLRG